MHELGLTQEIVAIVSEAAGARRVRRVVLEIGRLSAVLPDAIQFCFGLCAEGTNVEAAVLEIIEVPGRVLCHDCGLERTVTTPVGLCPCGGTNLDWLAGEELRIKEMEVA